MYEVICLHCVSLIIVCLEYVYKKVKSLDFRMISGPHDN